MTIETVTGTDGDDFLLDTGGRTLIFAGSGDDWITTFEGRDTIEGQDGNDTIYSYNGGTVISGGDGNDKITAADRLADLTTRITGGGGNDTIFASMLMVVADGGAGDDDVSIRILGRGTVSGGDGIDRLTLTVSDPATMQPWNGSVRAVLSGPGAGVELSDRAGFLAISGFELFNITTGQGDDDVTGGYLADQMNLGGGANTALGLGGRDVIALSAGAANLVDGGAGMDRLVLTLSDPSLALGLTRDLSGMFTDGFGGQYSSIEVLTLTTGSGNDTLQGSNGRDVVLSNGGNDLVLGFGGNDNLRGGAGADSLRGGAGADALEGGKGSDDLAGGLGADRFILALDGSADLITDFASGSDLICLRAADLGGTYPKGALAADKLSMNEAVGDGSQFVWRMGPTPGQLSLSCDSNGSAAGGEVLLANFSGVISLAAADFLIL